MKTCFSVCSRWKVTSRKWRMRWTSLQQTWSPLHHFLNRYRVLYRYRFKWWFYVHPKLVNIVGEWSALPLYIREVSGSYCTWKILTHTEFHVMLLSPGKCHLITWNEAVNASFHFIFYLMFCHVQNRDKQLLASSCLSVHMEQLSSHWTDFH